jgi:tripartite-type tricarboxylate transporter receptor subunit TctC
MTQLSRRRFMHFAAAAAGLPTIASAAGAQTYPTRPVRVIVPFPPGGLVDTIARPIGQWLSDRLHKPFIIENRSGAGTNIGTEAVVRAPPDGHTLLLASTANAINATLFDGLSFDFIRDLAPVAGIVRSHLVKDCTVVCVDGVAADARLTGERRHCQAMRAIA